VKVKDLTFWQNRKRVEVLVEYRNSVVEYFNGYVPRGLNDPTLTSDARNARQRINRLHPNVTAFLRDAGIRCVITEFPAPAFGGFVKEFNIIDNIYDLRQLRVDPNRVLDFVERAIAVYEDDFGAARLRTFNPFFWIRKGLTAISAVPFAILENAGFHGKKLEDSFIGKLVKLLTELVALLTGMVGLLAALFALLKSLGKQDWLTRWLP
jgi:hypothetical protein